MILYFLLLIYNILITTTSHLIFLEPEFEDNKGLIYIEAVLFPLSSNEIPTICLL